MTRPDAKQVKAMTEVAGVPRTMKSPRASPIPSARPSTASRRLPARCRWISSLRAFFWCSARRCRNERRAGLDVAGVGRQGDRGKKFSSREVTQSCLDRIAQWQPRVNAFMAIEADEALAAADAADAALAKGNNAGVLHGVPLAHKDMYYDAGKVVTCGSKIRRDFVADDDLDRAAAPEGRRHRQARLAADGRVRLWPDRP